MKKFILFSAVCVLSCICLHGQEVPKKWSLQECIEYALEHNIQIKQKSIQQEDAKIQVNTAKMSRLPNLNAGMDQGWSFDRNYTNTIKDGVVVESNDYKNRQISNTGLSVSSSMPLFTGFRINNEIKQKELNLEAATYSLEKAKEDLSLSITSLFLQVLFNQELLKVDNDQLQLSVQQVNRTQDLVDAGKVALSQLYDMKAQVARDEANVTQSSNNLQLALLDLAQSLELTDLDGFNVETPDLDNVMKDNFRSLLLPNEIYRNALQVKPHIKEQLSLLESSKSGLKIAQSDYFPKLDLSLNYNTRYGYQYGVPNHSFSQQFRNNAGQSIGLSLSIPLFNRFQVRNQVKSARLNILNQELNLDNTKKDLYKEIQTAYYNAVGAQEKFKAAIKSVEASKEAFQYALERYKIGKLTVFEFNEAQSKLTQSLSEQIQAKYDYIFRSKILDFYNGVAIRL